MGFSLVEILDPKSNPYKDLFVTTTLFMIGFTVFLQGGTIKWLVNVLNIEKSSDGEPSLMVEMNDKLFDHIMAGVESISGKHGQYYFQDLFNRVDEKILMKIFCSSDAEHDMVRMYDEVIMKHQMIIMINTALLGEYPGSLHSSLWTRDHHS